MLIVVNWSVNWYACVHQIKIKSGNLSACAPAACSSCTHRPINRTLLGLWLHFSPHAEISRTARELKSKVWIGGQFRPQNRLPRQRPLRNRKTNFRSFIYSRSSTIAANWVKISPVDLQTKGLTETREFCKSTFRVSYNTHTPV